MNKKAIAILGVIFFLIVGTLGFLIYSKYSGNKATPAPTPSPAAQTPAPTPSPEAASSTPPVSNIVQLTTDQVVSPALFYNGQGVSYFDTSGNLYQASFLDNNGQISLTGKKQLLVPPKSGITKVLWPSKGTDFIAQITDSTGKVSFSYFNSQSGVFTDLPPQIESIDWMPNGTQVVYVWLSNGKASLSLASPDAKTFQKLADLWETDDSVHVSPDGSQILYYETGGPGPINNINSVSIDGKIFKGLVKTGYNYGVLWSPDGQKFLFGKKDPSTSQYQIWIDNLSSGEIQNLTLNTTIDKVTWDSDSTKIYAAVPTQGTPGPSSLTVDAFYSLNISTLEKKQYPMAAGSAPIDGRNLLFSAGGGKLFFKNAQDGGFYYLDLTQQ